MTTSPEDDALTRDEDQLQRTAEQGDGLAQAVRGKITGEGVEDDEDTADGEDATE